MQEYSKKPLLFICIVLLSFAACSRHKTKPAHGHKACGDQPTIEKSIENCNTSLAIKNADWRLVHRSPTGSEIWADMTEKEKPIFWGPSSSEPMGFQEAGDHCKNINTSTVLHEPTYAWTMPDFNDYGKAELHGIRSVLPDMKRTFWTSTYSSPFSVYLFDGVYASLTESDIKISPKKRYIRCIYKKN